jgi:uncharacterized protein YbjT (DUF2867 family)
MFMFIVLGATGHVGSEVARQLLAAGEAVTVVSRNKEKVEGLQKLGAKIEILDVSDVAALRAVFRKGQRAFLLNPPADPSIDTDAEEHRTLGAIVEALDGAGLEKLVLQSTYGAQEGEAIGDLSVLHDFEQALGRQPIPFSTLRAAYYMSNWDAMLEPAKQGTLPTFFPPELALPMVAPSDLGQAAARLLREPVGQERMHFVEGPARYTVGDVAAAFGKALNRTVELAVTPRENWEETYRQLGFSAQAAAAYARMTAVTVDGAEEPQNPERGVVTLESYIAELVRQGDVKG